ncbi:MAG: hypothetical protein WC000_12590 [Dokdonella sp.]
MRNEHRERLRTYMVRVFCAGAVVRQFEAIGTDSCAVSVQHMDTLQPGEKLDVMSMESWRELQSDRRALMRQIERPDALTAACTGGQS